jgi:TusA-related sulfurtransferase
MIAIEELGNFPIDNSDQSFCKQTGNELLSSGEEGGKFMFMIKKAA